MEIEIYKKFGVAILTTNDWCVYENQALATLPSASYNNNLNPHDFAPYTK